MDRIRPNWKYYSQLPLKRKILDMVFLSWKFPHVKDRDISDTVAKYKAVGFEHSFEPLAKNKSCICPSRWSAN